MTGTVMVFFLLDFFSTTSANSTTRLQHQHQSDSANTKEILFNDTYGIVYELTSLLLCQRRQRISHEMKKGAHRTQIPISLIHHY